MRMRTIRICGADFTLQRLTCQDNNIQLNLNSIQLLRRRADGFPPIPLLYTYLEECQTKNIQLKVNSIQLSQMRMILISVCECEWFSFALRLSARLRQSGKVVLCADYTRSAAICQEVFSILIDFFILWICAKLSKKTSWHSG
jgi:hypothetical protein